MRSRYIWTATASGIGLVIFLMLLLARPPALVHADPGIYYVREGGTSTTCITVTDPCSSVQRAIDLATSPGDEVWVAAGTYTENLVITHGVRLRGGWNVSFTAQAPVSYPATLDGSREHVISASIGADSGLIEGLTVRNGHDGIHLYSGIFTLTGNFIYSTTMQGIEVTTGTVWIEDNAITDTGDRGIEIGAGTAVITGNHVHAVRGDGIRTDDECASVEIMGNKVYSTAGDGIDGRGWVGLIASNTISNTAEHGIRAQDGPFTIRDNTLRDVGSDGIHFEDEDTDAEIIGNSVYDAGSDGIRLYSGVFTVTGNSVYSTAKQGIQVTTGTVWIEDNTVTETDDRGIEIGGGTVVISNNRVYTIDSDGIRTDDTCSSVEIISNTVHNTDADGIDARGQMITLTANLIRDAGKDGIHVEGTKTALVQRNTIYNASDDGIDSSEGAVLLIHNLIDGCGENGVKSENATRTFIDANQIYNANQAGEANKSGIDLDEAGAFTVTNNIVANALANSVLIESAAGPRNAFYHNTLVGSATGRQGVGISVTVPGITVSVINNIVISHVVDITQAGGATLIVSHTLSSDQGSLFINPLAQDYHLPEGSPAIDAGIDVGVETDIDGDPRIDDAPDIGADEFMLDHHQIYLPLILRNYPPPPPEPPLYDLYADPDDLAWLIREDNLDSNKRFPAEFVYEREWEVEFRLRGDVSRRMPKKNWKLFFPGSDLFQNQEELNLNADYPDQTLLRSYINYDLFDRVGVPASRAGYARLNINDEYYGLCSQAEQVDELFLYRQGIDIHGNLYKPYYGGLHVLDYLDDPEEREWWYRWYYPKKTNRQSDVDDVIAFIELINHTPDAQFPEAIAEVLDVNEWLDWYAVNILIGNFEMMEKNYYIYHDLSQGQWIILPWDLDLALGHNAEPGAGGWGHLLDTELSWDNPIDSGTEESKKNDGKWNALIDRMMGASEFRFYHCRRLQEMMADEFSPAEMFPRIDETYAYIEAAGQADPNRWKPEGFQFSDGPAELKTYITNRIQFLQGEMPNFCPDLEVPLSINEVMAENASTIADQDGDYDDWIEIYNHSSTLTWDLGGMYLTNNLEEPTMWRVPDDTLLPPGGVILLWADGEEDEGGQPADPLHTNFTLDAAGGQIGLFDQDVFTNAPISVLTYTAQMTDVSSGRMPDGSGVWQTLANPTPGWRNEGRPPSITGTTRTPSQPAQGDPVTVTTVITDDGVFTATLWYRAFDAGAEPPDYQATPMDGGGDGSYSARIPSQDTGTWVAYYVEAEDEAGMSSVDRPGWPQGDYRYIVGWERPPLYINELMAINDHTLEDDEGDYDDWFELYNAGTEDVDLGGMFLSNNVGLTTQYTLPVGTVVPAGGYLVLWADDGDQGTHIDFKLSGAGEYIGLFDSEAGYYAPIDAVYFDPQTPDVSWGRFPDPATSAAPGEEAWYAMDTPTPGAANRLRPPQFLQVERVPRWPDAGESVTVTAVITAGTPVVSATLWIDAGSGFQAAPMTNAGTGWQSVISPQLNLDGTLVDYYLEAVDGVGQRTLHPSAAPTVTHRYRVGYEPPPVVVNEFLADNETVNQDEAGEYEDWLELYNRGAVTATLEGMYLTDDLGEPKKWQLPAGASIPPGGYLLVWCDGDLGQGPLHADFKLSRHGEEIGLFADDAHGNVPLDMIVFGPQQDDVSYGRKPDGADTWEFLDPPSPEAGNE